MLNGSESYWPTDRILFSRDTCTQGGNCGNPRNCFLLKELLQRNIYSHLFGGSDDLDTENRVSSQVKKVIMYSYLFNIQNTAPNFGQRLLYRSARGNICLIFQLCKVFNRWQGLLIYLAVCREGKSMQMYKNIRHKRLKNMFGQKRAKLSLLN